MNNAGEKAMALVDGQLAPAEVPSLVQELARNATLVAELQDYLATSRSRLARPYAAKADEPVPDRLIDAVMRGPAEAPPRSGRRLPAWLRGSCRVPTWSLAAAPGLAAAMAFAVALAVLPGGHGDLAQANLEAALEKTGSGKDAPLATLRPMLSFNSKSAGWCRQFEVRNASRQVSHGLACRGESGDWKVVASTAPGPAGRYVPAGSNRRQAIDDLATSMMRDQPLSQEGEAAAIGNGWGPP
jgi:hypothetical protein